MMGRPIETPTPPLEGAAADAASRWADFQPPRLPEAEKLREAVKAARKLTPRAVLKISIAAGIHNTDGTLTSKYR